MPIRWVTDEPWPRRKETLITAVFCWWIFFGELSCLFLLLGLLIWGPLIIQTAIVGYMIFIIFIDNDAGRTGGRKAGNEWIRGWGIWKHYLNYFPYKLHKTVDIPADKNYIFAVFPHGIVSLGAFGTFGNDASGFKQLFPKIRPKLLTLGFHFHIPIFREFCMAWGMASVAADSVKCLLNTPNDPEHPFNRDGFTSNAIAIVVGGAQESLHCRPNNYKIVIKRRKGFVRLAMQSGAGLVPVMTFGEVDLYGQPDNPPGSKLRKFQEFVKSTTGIAPAFYVGRGILQHNYGIVPRRMPMNTVVGAPIDIVKCEDPSREEVDRIHALFCEKLTELFEANKSKYIKEHEKVFLVME